jgi:hypothetical protein
MSCHLIMPAQVNSEILDASRLGVIMIQMMAKAQ